MDGKGRWIDNVVIERFWRTIKYEDIYLQSYYNPNELKRGVTRFMLRYSLDSASRLIGGSNTNGSILGTITQDCCVKYFLPHGGDVVSWELCAIINNSGAWV